jgi:hypothetical protein
MMIYNSPQISLLVIQIIIVVPLEIMNANLFPFGIKNAREYLARLRSQVFQKTFLYVSIPGKPRVP